MAVVSKSSSGHRPDHLFPLPAMFILAASLFTVLPFLIFGNPSGHDFEFHMNSWMEVARQWRQGIFYPRWADLAHFGYGEPRFIFYPPSSWMLGAGLGMVLPWKAVPAAYICIALSLSGCSMFLLARRWLDQADAIFAATLYAANPYHIVIVYWRSAFAELLAAALLPLLLLLVLRLDEERRGILFLGIVVAGAWLTNAPAAVMVNYSLALLLALIAVRERSLQVLWRGTLALALGAALAAFYIFPASYEQRWVNIWQAISPGVRPQDNFLFTCLADPVHNQFNLLVSLVTTAEILVLSAAALCWQRWRARMPQAWWVLASWTAASALIMFPLGFPLWQYLPKLRFMQLPWRWLLCFNVGFALLVAVAWRRWLARLSVVIAMLGVLVFVWHRVQPPWWDTALDIAELRENIHTMYGYEGTDEYSPMRTDPYEVDRDARRATFDGNGLAQIRVLRWDPESKILTANVRQPGQLVLKLFNYPAWQIEVNGQVMLPGTRPRTGQMTISLQPGENDVHLTFIRSWDRTLGAAASAIAAILVIVLLAIQWRPTTFRPNKNRACAAS